jgi:hypothetical protein
MTRRPAVTLMEVLIAMFIMAIGMMALLALFPVGAVSMAQALKDDRCAYASSMAENVAIVNNVRYGDANVTVALTNSPLVYVDPYGVILGPLGGIIPRVSPSFITNAGNGAPQLTDRWFSLPDDIGFNASGTPDTSNTGGIIDRGRRYTWAYLLRQPALSPQFPSAMKAVQLFAVVYSGRPVNSLATTPSEWPFVATVFLPNGLQLPAVGTTAKRGGWILDTTFGNFYRVTNIVESGGVTTLETQQNLQVLPNQTTMNIVIMDYVAEVFDKGYGWQQ